MSASKSGIASDLAKVDAYENTASDYEEIPEITDDDMARAIRHRNGVAVHSSTVKPKTSVTLQLDAEIIEHFRALGPGWQGKINDALTRLVQADTKRRAPKS